MFRTVHLSIIGSFSLAQQWYMFTDSLQANCQHNQYVLLCVHFYTQNDGQKHYPKHTEFYCCNKFETLKHIVWFIIRINFTFL